ncbi:Replication protein A2 [Carabus blaptoides fortunei]
MWNSKDTSASGTGFFNTTAKFNSPGTGSKKQGSKTKRSQSVTPVVISMIKKCVKNEFTMWSYPTSILKFVCIVRKFDVTSTTVTYGLEDHTGRINAVLWLEQDDTSQPNIPVDKENIYVRVYGTLRNKGGEKLIMILKMAPIDKLNELTCHLYEVLYKRVMAEKKSKGLLPVKPVNQNNVLGRSNTRSSGMSAEEQDMTAIQRDVYRFMKSVKSEVGINRADIINNFPPNQKKDVDGAIQFLVNEGHIFSTIDHDHFQLTTLS